MKRSPLKRKTPLARCGSLKRSAMKRQPMKRYRKPSAVAHADALAAAIVHARGICAVHVSGRERFVCAGDLEQHHARGRGRGFRWRTESHLLLCQRHHRDGPFSAHGSPANFKAWLRYHHPEIANLPDVPETAEQAVERLQNAPDQARRQPSPEAGCSPSFAYISGWAAQRLTCAVCGTTKSVKYRLADGRSVCNLCVGKANNAV